MTCILGMVCQDGIVLGADREINESISKYGQSKIVKRTTWGKTPYFLACTSGDMNLADMWITSIKRAIKNAEQVGASITKAVRELYQELLFGTQEGTASSTAFIWVYKDGQVYKLYHLYDGKGVANHPWVINGSGFDHTVGLMSELYRNNMTLNEGAVLAVYLLKVAKMRASGVGEPSEILLLNHNGEVSMLKCCYVESLESDFSEMHKIFQAQIKAKLASQTAETAGIGEIYELLD